MKIGLGGDRSGQHGVSLVGLGLVGKRLALPHETCRVRLVFGPQAAK